ncbi:MAG: M1 family metallopeptidase, partial [Saprospiraceae bacterium]
EKGLFFINPLKKEGDKPQQIWTQGETENNSAWFPTVDKPNERTTQEVYLTVRDEFETLCNGLLKSSKKNSDGTRTDYWKMSLPHAPYLFMLTIGDFAVVKDDWNGMLLEYYVEKEYKAHAKKIFEHTPEMLTFFSDFMGVKYPWEKYSQVVVRDYVSGAMENTTAVIFGDFVQRTDRELIDNGNERIVAHEMMHHWFGDLVTCESWANLSMNEGFANYSEYLWFEHKYGRDYADYHLMGEQRGYIASANQGGAHPLIHFGYEDKESMFDAHSYNKGGAILHMLRYAIGTDAFRAGLKLYLERNQYTAVEAHDLRKAFEDVTGRDLNWFFNQWYFNQGHPSLDIQYDYDAGTKEAIVSIEQTQDPKKNVAVFVLPMAVHIYDANGKATRHEIMMNERGQEFRFKVAAEPALIQADADHALLAEIKEEKTETQQIFQFYNAPLFKDRYDAMMAVKSSTSAEAKKLMTDALNDPFWNIRNAAVTSMNLTDNPAAAEKLAKMAKNDKHSTVRSSALLALAETGDKQYAALAKNAIDNEKPYTVVSAGLSALTKLDPESAAPYAAKLENEKSSSIVAAVGQIYAQSGDVSKMAFFEKKFDKVDGYGAIEFMTTYAQLAINGGDESAMKAADNLNTMAMNMSQTPWRRFGSTRALHSIYMNMKTANNIEAVGKLKGYITKIKETETNDQLKS